jgi:hypothetical protein
MDLFDILQQRDINDLREDLERLRRQGDHAGWDMRKVKKLAEELLELKLRVGLLVRLLVAKGVFTAEEFAALLTRARTDPPGPGQPPAP